MEKYNKFTLKTIIHDLLYAVNLNEGFIPTCRDLVLQPQRVVHHYFSRNNLTEIKRKKYFSCTRVYISIFAIISVFSFFYGEDIMQMPSLIKDSNPADDKIFSLFEQFGPLIYLLLSVIPVAIAMKMVFLKNKTYNTSMHIAIQLYTTPISMLLAIPVILFAGYLESSVLHTVGPIVVFLIYYTYVVKKIFKKSIIISFIRVVCVIILEITIIIMPILLCSVIIMVLVLMSNAGLEFFNPFLDWLFFDLFEVPKPDKTFI